jgi:hypothetical protein
MLGCCWCCRKWSRIWLSLDHRSPEWTVLDLLLMRCSRASEDATRGQAFCGAGGTWAARLALGHRAQGLTGLVWTCDEVATCCSGTLGRCFKYFGVHFDPQTSCQSCNLHRATHCSDASGLISALCTLTVHCYRLGPLSHAKAIAS